MDAPLVRQGSTLLRATKATAVHPENGYKNATWKFTGQVHLEFDGAVLDAEAATVGFAAGRLNSIDVQAAPPQPPRQQKKPVHLEFNNATLDVDTAAVAFADGRIKTVEAQGSPAVFSHQLKKTGQRASGRANRINYDAGKTLVHLTDAITFFYDGNTFDTNLFNYNLTSGAYDTGPGTSTHSAEERVPAPRTPDRASAK